MKKILFLFLISIVYFLNSCSRIDIYEDVVYCAVELECQNAYVSSKATGTLISKDGLIITNKHAIKDYTRDSTILVRFINGEEYEAEIERISSTYDLCLLKIEKETECFNSFSETFEIGEEVYTIGNSNGYGLVLNQGIISSYYKNVIYKEESILSIQTSIEIYDGSSGGPLYNCKKELLGIMTFRIRENGNYVPGMSFAIPTKSIKEFLRGDNRV